MKKNDLEVAIVGAGMAGIAAALALKELGVSAEIFEAGNQVGGRIQSDEINGYILDRGFQLINLVYPSLKRYYQPEKFHHLDKSIDLVMPDRLIRLGDPRSDIGNLFTGLSRSTGSLGEKIRFLRYLQKISPKRLERNFDPQLSFEEAISSEDIGLFYSRVLRPFMQGVFLTDPDEVSHDMAAQLIQYFIKGEPGLSYGGIGKVPQELAKDLDIHLGSVVGEIGSGYIKIKGKKVRAKAIIVATDPIAASSLLQDLVSKKVAELMAVKMVGSDGWYFAADDFESGPRLRLDGSGGGPCINSIAVSKLAPEYAPVGKVLISATVLGQMGQSVSQSRVRKHLSQLWKCDTSSWEFVAKYWLPKSLPLFPPDRKKNLSKEIGIIDQNIILAGDYLTMPSQEGAMASGLEAAESAAQLI